MEMQKYPRSWSAKFYLQGDFIYENNIKCQFLVPLAPWFLDGAHNFTSQNQYSTPSPSQMHFYICFLDGNAKIPRLVSIILPPG